MLLWKQVPVEEGQSMVYGAVHILSWDKHLQEPATAFDYADDMEILEAAAKIMGISLEQLQVVVARR